MQKKKKILVPILNKKTRKEYTTPREFFIFSCFEIKYSEIKNEVQWPMVTVWMYVLESTFEE